MASKAAKKTDIDRLIQASSERHMPIGLDWYSRMTPLARSVADKVAERGPSATSAITIMQEVMETACPADVPLIPSEGTIRRWLRKRRNKNP